MSQLTLNEMQDRISLAVEAFDLDQELVFKPMFGGVCAYVSGRIFASLSNVGLAIKLLPALQDELLRVPDAKRLQYEPDAPPSKQYIVVPSEVLSDAENWKRWLKESLDYVLAQPAPKPKVARKPAPVKPQNQN